MRRRSNAWNALASGALAAPLLLAISPQALPHAAVAPALPPVNTGVSVPVHPFTPHNPAKPAAEKNATIAAVNWPAAATGTAILAAPGTTASDLPRASARHSVPTEGSLGVKAYASGTPVWAQTVEPTTGVYQGPTSMKVSVLSRSSTTKAGVNGVLFTVTPASSGRGSVRLGVDYSSFAQAFGGNFGSRLHLATLPACALTTPQLAECRKQTPLKSTNDFSSADVWSQLTTGAAPAAGGGQAAGSSGQPGQLVIAVNSSPSGGDGGGNGGTYGATSLKPSGSWSEGGSSGSFTYSYPITVPPAVSSLVPTVGLSYDSGSVDGQTAATQAQADWAGDGWSTPENFIEQSFVACADLPEGSAATQATGDLCYDGPVLTLSLNGSTSSLVCASDCNSASAIWKPTTDNGEVVTHHVNAGNGTGTYNSDYWTVTDRTGTQFSFGLNHLPGWTSGQPETKSVQSEPVFSGHDPSASDSSHTYTDPCYHATWASSWCTMAYRWNLDYVKDLHGNAMAYYYKQDTNAYAKNTDTSSATSYVRDAHLDHIDYGFTDGNAYGTIPDKVQFSTGERCIAGPCDPIGTYLSNWPDVPYDLNCTAGAACQVTSPSFWSTVRLAEITTEQYNGTGYTTVDDYTFTHVTPATGDDTAATLWLQSIKHKAEDTSAGGAEVDVPAVTFAYVQEPNRVDSATDGLATLNRMRIKSITTETGSVISVTYKLNNPCTAPVTLTPATNTSSCFPVYWTPDGGDQLLDWFNKYVVDWVAQSDPSGGAVSLFTQYFYNTGAAWHYDDNEVVQSKYRTYAQYRGYGNITSFSGKGADPLTETQTSYYRGMSDDNSSTAVMLTDSQGHTHEDVDQLAGKALETTSYNYKNGPVTGSTITSYWVSPPTLSRSRAGLPPLTANAVGEVETWTRTALTDGGTTTWRKTETDTAYDTDPTDPTFGLPTIVYQHGDLSLNGNNQTRCTLTTYAPANSSLNLAGLTAEVEIDADPCGGTSPAGASAPVAGQINALTAPTDVDRSTDVISDTRTYYDLKPLNSTTEPTVPANGQQNPPTHADASLIEVATGYTGGAFTYQMQSAATYDTYGRKLDTWDGLGHETQTSITLTNGLVTTATATNPLGQTVTTVLDPYRDLPISTTDPNGVVTQVHYDGMGRTIAVWDYSRPTSAAANNTYTYVYGTATTPTVVTTQTLNEESKYTTSTTLYDAILRVRQTQTPSVKGGRLISDTFYDSHGWATKTNGDYYDGTTAPNGTLMEVADNLVDRQALTAYDGLGRPVEVQAKDNAVTPPVDDITYTQYTGDKTITVPPTGGVATATVVDALGRTTELDQYSGAPAVTATTTGGITTVSITGGTTQATDYVFGNTGWQTDIKSPGTAAADWKTSYNMLGQPTSKTDPDAGTTTGIAYDPVGNILRSTDARGTTISYTYDALNRKTGEYAQASTSPNPVQVASWVYDNSDGAITNMANPIGHLTSETAYVHGNAYRTQQLGFNVFGEALGENVDIPTSEGVLGKTYQFINSYTPTTGLPKATSYAAGGNLSAETVTTMYNTYYDIDVVSGLGSSIGGYTYNITYTDLGQVGQQVIGSKTINAAVTNNYDPLTGNLTDQQIANTAVSPTPIDDTAYRYDPAGNPTRETETRNGTQTETQCYQYDALDRLIQAWTANDQCAATPTATSHTTVADGVPGGAYWSSWQYNDDGTRKSETDHSLTSGVADTATSYTYGGSAPSCDTSSAGLHTLASSTTTGPSPSNNSYCYDAAGNTAQHNVGTSSQQSFAWDDLGQLQGVTNESGGSSYIYDADGNLLLQKDPGTTTLYLPGEQLALNTSTNTVTATRFYALPGGGQAVRTGSGSNYYFELTDQHDTSTLTLSNTLANPVWRQQTPYGAPRGTAPTAWPDNHGFLNKPQDTTTGLTDIGARWYDPTTGTFASVDPVLEATSPQQLNGYSYAADNPVTSSDPSGLFCDGCSTGNPDTVWNNNNGPGCTTEGCYDHSGRPISGPDADYCANNDVECHLVKKKADDKLPPEKTPDGAYIYRPNLNELMYEGTFDPRLTYAQNVALYWRHKCGVNPGSFDEQCRFLVKYYDTWKPLASIPDNPCGAETLCEALPSLAAGLAGGEGLLAEDLAAGDTAAATDASIEQEAKAFEGCLANSFVGSTPVQMADGSSKPIDQVKVGDKIADNLPGADPGTKDQSHTVTAVHITYTDRDYTDVTIDTAHGPATITGTAHHPYWDATTRAWTDADRLHVGDELQTSDGQTVTIRGLRNYTTTAVTYNLTVADLHTYYVVAGDTPVLVHNDSLTCELGPNGWPKPNMDNCKACAEKIQSQIGGQTYRVTDSMGAPKLGPSVNDPNGLWDEHYVVIKDGTVYDGFTGPEGLPMDQYRAQWQYGEYLQFSPFNPEG